MYKQAILIESYNGVDNDLFVKIDKLVCQELGCHKGVSRIQIAEYEQDRIKNPSLGVI